MQQNLTRLNLSDAQIPAGVRMRMWPNEESLNFDKKPSQK
jgi:hypothetical protein